MRARPRHGWRMRELERRAMRDVRRRLEETREELGWLVIAVFDPDGEGADFAYTVGLHELGLPELHLWARPTDGTDPGLDFALSAADRGYLLNGWARRLAAGELGVGSRFSVPFDGGACFGQFEMRRPVPPLAVDAFQAATDATVIPVHWSLHR